MSTKNSLLVIQRQLPWLVVTLVPALCLIPFIDKAFNIDDPLFLWAAQQIQTHPLNFYDFTINWYGFDAPMSIINKNPPGVSYYIAAVAFLFGGSEIVLHWAFLVPALAVSLGTYWLAKAFCSHPVLATLIGILTPVFLVSSSSVMSDTLMLAFYIWAIVSWVYGLKYQNSWLLFISSLLIVLSAFSKYFGVSLIPLLFVYTWAFIGKPTKQLLFLLLPIVFVIGYEWLTDSLYGQGLMLSAQSYASTHSPLLSSQFLGNTFFGLCFLGGCYASVFFYTPWLWTRRVLINGLLIIALLMLVIVIFASQSNEIRFGFLVQVVLFTMVGLQIIALAVLELWERRNPEALLLCLWILGVFVFSSLLNWTVNARTLLPMLPAVGILVVRRLEQGAMEKKQDITFQPRNWSKTLAFWLSKGTIYQEKLVPLIPAAIVAILVLSMDYGLANSTREAASQITKKYGHGNGTLWFQGGWGFQYYMEKAGATKIDFSRPRIMAGDLMVIPMNNTNRKPPPENTALVETLYVPASRWGSTMSFVLGAGFYAHEWGILPFAFGAAPNEVYFIYYVLT